jgi:hypothetical protein
MRTIHSVLLVFGLATASPVAAATWNVYLPPPPYTNDPPPFSASTWTLVSNYDDEDEMNDCAGAALSLHYQYFNENQADSDRWKRALRVVCVNQQTGAIDFSNLKH